MINRFFAHCTRLRIALWWAALAVLLWAHPALAATRTVDTLVDNAGLTACTAAANDCSLRGALSGASANDTINFAPSLANQTVTLTLGELAINQPVILDGSTAPTVTISGNNASRVINASQPLTVTRLIIQNGLANNANGGGIYANSNLWLIDSVIRNNMAESGGGAYVVGAASITGTTFLSNTASFDGGGLYVFSAASITGTSFLSNTTVTGAGGGACVFGAASITGTSFLSNTAVAGSGGGACVNGAARIMATSFLSNTAGVYGGGVFVNSAASIMATSFRNNRAVTGSGGGANVVGVASITATSFLSNAAHLDGGGVVMNSAASITGTSFRNNTASGSGGGLLVRDAISITGASFLSNAAISYGGGASVYGAASITGTTFLSNTAGNGGGVDIGEDASIMGTTFLHNTASESGGGAIVNGRASITRTSFLSNTAQRRGGALYFYNSNSTSSSVVNNLFSRNRSLSNEGDALYIHGSDPASSVLLLHNTLANPTVEDGAAIRVRRGTVTFTNTLIANQAIAIERVGGAVSEDYSLFADVTTPYSGTVTTGTHSLIGAARFVDTSRDDYHLTAASAAIDMATTSTVGDDFDGAPRPQSTAPDIGAFESPYGLPTLSIGDASVAEGNSGIVTLIFPVTLSFAKGITVTAQYNTSDNSALAGSDYQPVNGTLSFAPGVTSQSINVVINADQVVERDETFNVNLSNSVNATLGKANGAGVITNNDVTALTISDVQRAEGNSGATSFVFTVTLSNPSALPITVTYATSDGSATIADSDYTAASGTLIIAPTIVSQSITVNVVGDTSFENNETFTLTLSSPLGATLADGVAEGTIVNDDTAPTALADTDEPTSLPARAYLPLVTRLSVPGN